MFSHKTFLQLKWKYHHLIPLSCYRSLCDLSFQLSDMFHAYSLVNFE